MLLADRYGVVLSRPRRRPKEARHRVQVVIDLKLLREDPEVVRRSQRSRGEDAALVDALNKAKPASSKGVYLRKVAVSSTMGVGVRVDLQTIAA